MHRLVCFCRDSDLWFLFYLIFFPRSCVALRMVFDVGCRGLPGKRSQTFLTEAAREAVGFLLFCGKWEPAFSSLSGSICERHLWWTSEMPPPPPPTPQPHLLSPLEIRWSLSCACQDKPVRSRSLFDDHLRIYLRSSGVLRWDLGGGKRPRGLRLWYEIWLSFGVACP